jgi:hypothetical protein
MKFDSRWIGFIWLLIGSRAGHYNGGFEVLKAVTMQSITVAV